MKNDREPILISCDRGLSQIHLYFAHDWHIGSPQHDQQQRDRLLSIIHDDPLAKVIVIGDLSEYVMRNSKGDIYETRMSPQEQKERVSEIIASFYEEDKLLCVVPGNHERNRVTKESGMYPLYDACVMARCQDLFRPHFAFVDIGVGESAKNKNKQVHYVGYITHTAKSQKFFHTADKIDGIDFMAYGHDHDPSDHARARLVYDAKNKCVTDKDVEVINCGALLKYGGYAVDNAYTPLSRKKYYLEMHGGKKEIRSIGFHTD